MRHTATGVSAVKLSGLLMAFLAACQSNTAGPAGSPSQLLVSPSPASPTASPTLSPTALPTLTASPTFIAFGPMLPPGVANAVFYVTAYPAPYGQEHSPPIYQYFYVPISAEGELLGLPQVWLESSPGGFVSGIYPSPDGRYLAIEVCSESGCGASAWAPATGEAMSSDLSLAARAFGSQFLGWAGDSSGILHKIEIGDGSQVILTTDRESRTLFELEGRDRYVEGAALAPDGRILIYCLAPGGGCWRLDIPTQATGPFPVGIYRPSWSPNGQWLAFYGEDGLMLARPDGSDAEPVGVHLTSRNVYFPIWSPSGDGLAFMAQIAPPPEHEEAFWDYEFAQVAYVADITDEGAGAPRPVVPGSVSGYIDPAWSPDGRYLLVMGSAWNNADVWLVSRDGRIVRQMTFDGGRKRYPVWIRGDAP